MTLFRNYGYTLSIAAGVAAALAFPGWFQQWGPVDLRGRWMILFVLQAVMFGMGTQMSWDDFRGVVRAPRGVAVGMVCHFSIMPLTGLALTRIFGFPPEIAAGVILVGSCSSGLASNVMAYFAGSNLALSVTVTALTTLVSPVLTPLLVKLLAGTLIAVRFEALMLEIVRIVIVPIGAALLSDAFRRSSPSLRRWIRAVALSSLLWLAFLAAGGWPRLASALPPAALTAVGLAGYVAEGALLGYLHAAAVARFPAVARAMPLLSMSGIVYMTTVTTAAGRDQLLQVGFLLVLCSMLHNSAGYVFGYWLSRASGLDRNSSRSVAFEVGLQNGGMASGLAAAMGKLATVGLAPALFSAWMNISGSLLAKYWRSRPVDDVA